MDAPVMLQAGRAPMPNKTIIAKHRAGYTIHFDPQTCLVYCDPVPSAKQLEEYYDGFLYGFEDEAALARSERPLRRAAAKIIDDLVRLGCSTRSLIDVGGGVGSYANAFRDHVAHVAMYDIDGRACEWARQHYGERIEILRGTPESRVPTDETFDIVFSSHVIEHVVDIAAFFSTVTSLMHEESVAVIVTPNRRTWERFVRLDLVHHYAHSVSGGNLLSYIAAAGTLFRLPWLCCDPPRHCFAFDRQSLIHFANLGGLSEIAIFTEYNSDSAYARSASHRLTQSWRPMRFVKWLVARFNVIAMKGVRVFDARQEHGGNLVLIARRCPKL